MTTVKCCHAPTIWKKLRWKSLGLLILKSIKEIMKNFKSLYGFGGLCLKIRDVCMDFEPYLKVHNLISVHLKSIILGQITNLNMIVHVMVSVYRLVKVEVRPSSLLNFGTAYYYRHVCNAVERKWNIVEFLSLLYFLLPRIFRPGPGWK